MNSSNGTRSKGEWVAVAALWLHLFWSLIPTWRNGQYYDYGHFVPILAIGFAWRRVAQAPSGAPWPAGHGGRWLAIVVVGLILLGLLPLRLVETGDPGWRPPLLVHALAVTVASHLLLARIGGWRYSRWFLPVTLFAWSAVPLLYQVEQAVVRHLTGTVIGMTGEIFLLQGLPVQRLGERLVMGNQICEVTDGCSGIRSVQSLIMAALFFGELLWLRWLGRMVLVLAAFGAAVITNSARAWYLATVHFSRGSEGAAAAHDLAGHLAFGAAALMLFLLARWVGSPTRGRVVRQVATVGG